jgi:hypothetical protein
MADLPIQVYTVGLLRKILEHFPDDAVIMFRHIKGNIMTLHQGCIGLWITDLEPCNDQGCKHAKTLIFDLLGKFIFLPKGGRNIQEAVMEGFPAVIVDEGKVRQFYYALDKDGEAAMFVYPEKITQDGRLIPD